MSSAAPENQSYTRNRNAVYALAVTPDGTRVVIGGSRGVEHVDRHTGEIVREEPLTPAILSVAVNIDDVIVGTSGGPVLMINESPGNRARWGSHDDAVFAVASVSNNQIVSAGRDGVIAIWGRVADEPVWRFEHGGPVLSLAVSSDSRIILSGGLDGTIILWNRETGARRDEPIPVHGGGVHALALTPDGTRIVSAHGDGAIRVWHFDSGRSVGYPLLGHTGAVYALAVTPNGAHVVSGGADGTVRLWDLVTRQQVGEPLTADGEHRSWQGPVSAVVVTPDGNGIFAATRSGSIRSWERDSGQPPRVRLGRHRRAVYSVAVSSAGTEVLSVGQDRTIRRWSLDGPSGSWTIWRSKSPLYAVSIDPHDKWMVAGRGHVWRNDELLDGTGRELPWLRLPGPIYAIANTSDGSTHLGCADGTVRRAGAPADVIGRHDDRVYAVAVTPDGHTVVSASSDGTLRIWRDGQQVGEPLPGHTAPYQSVAITPDGTRLISGFDDGTIRIWQLDTQEQVGALTGHTGGVLDVVAIPNGTQVVSAGSDGTVRIWDLLTLTQVGEPLIGHRGAVHSVAVTPDSTTIVSGGADGQVLAWDRIPRRRRRVVRTERAAGVLTDAESTEDRLGMAADVHTMAALLAATDTAPPLSVALLGNWGSGKSTFMRLVSDRVKQLAAAAAGNPASGHVVNVRQVRFNAWHYSDDHLWAGLVEQLFRGLREPVAETRDDHAELVTRLEADLAAERARQDRLDRTLAEVEELDPDRGWWGWFGQLRRSLLVVRQAGREARQQVRVGRVVLGVLLVLAGVVAVIFGRQFGVFAWMAGVAATAAGLFQPVRAVWGQISRLTKSARTKLLDDKKNRAARIQQLETELNQLDPARQLDTLLAEITKADRYESYRGLTGRIHHDLLRLSDELARARRSGNASLQRIILYIDDLDRCLSSRVVEVLQAVNLLLSMPLFVVVVAVDPRWLLNALDEHHGKLLNAKVPTDKGRPLDYLDKIFHVPYAVRPVGGGGGEFLRALLPAVETPQSAPQTREKPRHKPASPTARALVDTALDKRSPSVINRSRTGWRVAPRGESPTALNTEGLRLRQVEAEFLPQLAVLLHTPRSIKKLANLYRLLRIGVPDAELEDFIGDNTGGPYQAAALLLAAVVANPGTATSLLSGILEAAPDTDITAVVRDLGHNALADVIKTIAGRMPVRTDTALYQRTARTVARYSFETYQLFTTG